MSHNPVSLSFFAFLITQLYSTSSLGAYEAEPNNTPQTATALAGGGVEHLGQLYGLEDVDFFRASLPVPTILSLSANPENSSYDGGVIRIGILDAQLRVLTERDLKSDSKGIAVAAAMEAGNYYIRVKRKEGYQIFDKDYLFSYELGSQHPRESEPNETSVASTGIGSERLEYAGQLNALEDSDFYRISIASPTVVTLHARPESSTYDGGVIRVALLDGQLATLAAKDLSSDEKGIALSSPVSQGTYYIRVKRKEGYQIFDKNYLIYYATEAAGPLSCLNVNVAGVGTVTSNPGGINCGATCSASFNTGQTITLTAIPAPGSVFAFWSGACSGLTTTCTVTMNSNQDVSAHFTPSNTFTGLYAAVLPYARSVQLGQAATAFGTIINDTGVDATNCLVKLPASPALPASFSYQTTNASNKLVGTPNTPANIPAGGSQGFVFGITPNAAFAATDIPVVFDCANTLPAPSQVGLNTFLLSASSTPVPDMVAIGATPLGDGVLRIPGSNGVHAFGTAAVNIGGAGEVTATVDTGGVPLPLTLTVCQTNPTTGACLSPPASTATSTLANKATATYAVLAQASGAIPFDPAGKRIFLRLSSGGGVRGATSVAVTTQ